MRIKTILGISLLGLIMTAGCLIYVQEPYDSSYPGDYYEEDPLDVDYDYFYDSLSPYGYWVNYAPHGYVWFPRNPGYGWRPYTRGRWIWTDYGWHWMSDFDWGWAAFHYGRWGWDNDLGWFWVPGTVWGPSWVTWRWGTSHFGWAPLPPGTVFMAGRGITSLSYDLPYNYWIFVEGRYFTYSNVYRYVLPWERNTSLIRRTVQRTELVMGDRYVINRGLDFDRVGGMSRTRIDKYQLSERPHAGKGTIRENRVEIYRPTVSKAETVSPKAPLSSGDAKVRIKRERLEQSTTQSSERKMTVKQQNEVRVLEQSHKREEMELKRKAEADKRAAQDAKEAKRVQTEYQKKSQQMKERQQKEKADTKARHQVDKSKTTKAKAAKKKPKKKK